MNKIYLTCIILTFSAFIFNSKATETYLEYEKRINSIRHSLEKGESISKVLIKKGYTNLLGKNGDIELTLLKNGIRKKDVKKIPIGKEIILPYKDEKENQRSIASVSIEETTIFENKLTHVSLFPTIGALQIKSEDLASGASGTIVSTLSYGLKMNWLNDWGIDSGWQTFLYASLQSIP